MTKIKIENNAFTYPEPVFLIGSMIDGKPNFMPAAWVSRVNVTPNMMALSFNPQRHTYKGIKKNNVFSINLPSINLVTRTDYCALVSGKNNDKSKMFELFYGENKNVPMIQECPICAECKVIQELSLVDHELVIGEVINTYIDENCLTDKHPDIQKIKPFIFTAPDNHYWADGETLGKAWGVGKSYK
jgi:flavin reductase (DIM6/NTAB) family NADH-FMN oxidoreductase RutF